MRSYRYVGPPEIRAAAAGSPGGARVDTPADVARWLSAGDDIATYVVTADGVLRIANRRSEHVACAMGGDVLAAGELRFARAGRVLEASNLSTGYCPEPSCWDALAAALDRAGVVRPAALTSAFVFRRCDACGERNLVKDDVFACALCDAELPAAWNF